MKYYKETWAAITEFEVFNEQKTDCQIKYRSVKSDSLEISCGVPQASLRTSSVANLFHIVILYHLDKHVPTLSNLF